MKKTFLFLIVSLLSILVVAQTTAIPDPYFEQELIFLGYDTGTPDGVVLTANINTVNSLYIAGKNISDLTGIEDFASLTTLSCGFNQITTLNLTQNTALTWLECQQNLIQNLDLTQNTSLTWLECWNNQLTSLDITQNTALISLKCGNNQLTSLDVTQNTSLVSILCNNNQISTLDVSQNINLTDLTCYINQLTSLNLLQNGSLNNLLCQNNQLTCLNVKNGNNSNFLSFNATYNSNLTCIEVDNVAYSTTNWTNIDPASSFNLSCPNPCITGVNEYSYSLLSIYPNPTHENVFIDLGSVKTNIRIILTNSLGKIIQIKQFEKASFIDLQIGDTPTGFYFLKLETDTEDSRTIKFLKI